MCTGSASAKSPEYPVSPMNKAHFNKGYALYFVYKPTLALQTTQQQSYDQIWRGKKWLMNQNSK